MEWWQWEPSCEIRVGRHRNTNHYRLEQKWKRHNITHTECDYEWRWVESVQSDWTEITDRIPA